MALRRSFIWMSRTLQDVVQPPGEGREPHPSVRKLTLSTSDISGAWDNCPFTIRPPARGQGCSDKEAKMRVDNEGH